MYSYSNLEKAEGKELPGILSETRILPLTVDEEAENCSIISEPCPRVGRFSHLSARSARFIKSIVGAGVLYVQGPSRSKTLSSGCWGFSWRKTTHSRSALFRE